MNGVSPPFITYKERTMMFKFFQFLIGPSPWVPHEDRTILYRFWYWCTNERHQRIATNVICLILIAALVVMGYTFFSFECALGRGCALASAQWAEFLLGRK